MATGGGFPRLKQSKSETKQRSSNWPRSVSSDKDDSLSLTSFPSDIRINNWDLSDLRPTASADSRRRKKSKGNPEREREQSLSMDSPPHGEPKQRTPTSVSRTRNTPSSHRDALEKLKQKLTYEEEQYSTDGERNNERSQARTRRRQANNREPEGATRGASGGGRRPRSNRINNTEHGQPDRNQIVGRLVQIQDYIKQAASMMDTLKKSGDSGNSEDLAKVGRLISNLQEQEQGYLSLLHTNATLLAEMAEGANDGMAAGGATKEDSDSEDVDLEVESNASESTETSSSSRPRIEDKLGVGSEDEKESDDDSKDEDTAMDNTMAAPAPSTATVNAATQAAAARSVMETLNSMKTESDEGATSMVDLTAIQRQHLMRVMMEKQEQLRQLQGRQDQLLNMKREAEQRLQQAQARDNQARAALAQVEAGQAQLQEEGAFLDLAEGQLKSNIVPYPESQSDDDEASNARESADPLSELQRQLNFLRNEFSGETGLRPRNNTGGSSGGGSVSGGGGGVVAVPGGGGGAAAATGLSQQQELLQHKLKDLQQKKASMDQLQAQLQSLRSQRLQVMNNAPEGVTGRPPLSPQQQAALQLPPPPPPPPTTTTTAPPPPQQSSAPQQQSQQSQRAAAEPDMAAMLASLGGMSGILGGMSGLGGLGGPGGLGGLGEMLNGMGGGGGGLGNLSEMLNGMGGERGGGGGGGGNLSELMSSMAAERGGGGGNLSELMSGMAAERGGGGGNLSELMSGMAAERGGGGGNLSELMSGMAAERGGGGGNLSELMSGMLAERVGGGGGSGGGGNLSELMSGMLAERGGGGNLTELISGMMAERAGGGGGGGGLGNLSELMSGMVAERGGGGGGANMSELMSGMVAERGGGGGSDLLNRMGGERGGGGGGGPGSLSDLMSGLGGERGGGGGGGLGNLSELMNSMGGGETGGGSLGGHGSLIELMNTIGGGGGGGQVGGGGQGGGGGLSGWPTPGEQGDQAGEALNMQEAREKLEKLQEVRERLNQLRDLVQYYQKMKTQPTSADAQLDDGQSETADQESLAGFQAAEESLLRSLPLAARAAAASVSSMGSVALQPPPPPEGAFLALQEGPASEEQSDEDNASASEDWESGMGPWDQDPEVQEKVRKLMKAKDKLRDLQGLIQAIESMPEGEKAAAAEAAAQSGGGGGGGGGAQQQRSIRGGQQQRVRKVVAEVSQQVEEILADGGAASISEGEVVAAQSGDPRDDPRVHQQMEELSRLREERQRLIALQQQLHTLQDRFVEAEGDSEGESRPEGSVRKGDGMQPPSTSVVTFASNDELYSKMRDQRIEREELRSKKKELEAIMNKDRNRRQYIRNQDNHSDTVSYTTNTDAFGASASADATMATWGGSTVDNLENITEDEDGQDADNRADEEDDGYPSDGIVQVEEEEEETDNGTYTISSDARDARQRTAPPPARGQSQGARPKTSRGRRGFPQPIKPAGAKKTSKRPQSQPWGRVNREPARQGQGGGGQRGQSREGPPGEDPTMRQFRQQVEQMSSLCQNLMVSPESSSGRSRRGKTRSQVATVEVEPAEPQPNMQSQLMREMQQQQLMMAVSQVNQQLMMQQFDMASLHRQLQQLTGQVTSMQQPPQVLLPGPAGTASHPHHPHIPPPGPPAGVLMPQPYLSPLSSTLAAQIPNNMSTSVNVQSSRQTTFTVNPNFTSNPFNPAAADPHQQQQQRLPVSSQGVQAGGASVDPQGEGGGEWMEGGAGSTFPRPMRLWEEGDQCGERVQPSQTSGALPRMNLQAFLKARRKKSSRRQSSEKTPQQKQAAKEREAAYRPGLSAGISGAGFDDAASQSSLASTQPEGAVGGQMSQAEDAGVQGELNLFEELRETIYTEVATLISQNESRPQFLLDLFTQLQCLNTDVMRRRGLFTLHDIIQTSSYVKPGPANVTDTRFIKMWPSRDDQDNVATELTPSESLLTSDDEEIKARVRQHASALERKKQKQRVGGWASARGNSLKDDKFDYVEAAATTSSLSTPTNDNGESPFSRDSLGDTVIHLDKALAKMRREMEQAEQERAERGRNSIAMEMRQEVGAEAAMGDQGSESSVSDLPYPSIDPLKLDEQIKGVMSQVIPVIKEHINDVFSPQLLSYVQRLVLSLVRQPGQNHEFARFFYGQLASILQDSLCKFEGRRVREVGEDVLLDMSEVLFNELAFLRIMRDLDNPVAMEKIRKHSWFSPLGSQRTSAAMVGEDYDAGGNESDNEASDDKDDDDDEDTTLQSLKANGVDEEEEELGKERDDELARKLVTHTRGEREDKDEDTEDPRSTSAVHIQLAMSETKPFTRIGSDEDTEGSDESLSLEDPSDTAVSRNAMMEHRQDTDHLGGSAAATTAMLADSARSPQPQKEAAAQRDEEKEADTSEADGTLESRGQADGSRGNSNVVAVAVAAAAAAAADASEEASGDAAGCEEKGEVQVNGHATLSPEGEETALGLDDLPPVLTVADPEGVDQKRAEEAAVTSGVAAIITSMDTGDELAGDGSALRDPDSAGK